MYCTACHGE